MAVTVETLEKLERKITLTLPADVIATEVDKRLKRLARTVRSGHFEVTADTAFVDVMRACAEPRPGHPESWINEPILNLYNELFGRGHAHSIECRRGGKLVTMLAPQKRVYRVQQNPMTEAAIDSKPVRDVFLALGDPLGNDAWSLRIQVKPMINFLWFGSAFMALGGILAITDRRYRELRQRQAVHAQAVGAA